jgi:hypothetical protein
MTRSILTALAFALTLLPLGVAHAAWTASASGVVTEVRFFTTDVIQNPTVVFAISPMPSNTGCSQTYGFALSSVTVTDPQTLKNFIAALLSARATGQAITVGYDSASASCDPSGFPRVYEIVL